LIAFCAQAHADGVFGRTDIGATPSAGMSAEFKRGSRFTLAANGLVNSICAYIDGRGGGSSLTQFFRFALYRDNNGVPGAKVVETDTDNAGTGFAPEWICEPTANIPLSPGAYWLVIHTSGSPGNLRYYYDGPADWFGNADPYVDGAADPFGTGGRGGGTISIYARYLEGVQAAGRTTVGAMPSSGILNDFKRASSFTVSGSGVPGRSGVYLDGLGAAIGSQFIATGLYRDANGVPGALVADGAVEWVRGGETGRWRTPALRWVKLTPGKYWFALQGTGDNGVARYALDGTGNWYGNPDSFADEMSNPFGAGSTGNGTISAFITYRPGTFTSGRFGRTSVATALQGLAPHYMRGSKFHLQASNELAVKALYAYLDGNGGAAGSQALRMAMYYDSSAELGPWPVKTLESGVVNIAAHAAPGWVRFPVPSTVLGTGDYWIMLQSGDATGVARSYGNGAANWRGHPDTFADGTDDLLSRDAVGTVTLSVYAEYDEFHPQ
jgi:hypothetical protein